jgi:hypothetical protein
METPKLIIKKSDLLREPCPVYDDLPEEFDAIEEIRKRGNDILNILWLMCNCKKARTNEILEYFKSLNPHYSDVAALIESCEFAQTNEMLEYFKSLKPSYNDVKWLIENCKFAKTKEMYEYLNYLKK